MRHPPCVHDHIYKSWISAVVNICNLERDGLDQAANSFLDKPRMNNLFVRRWVNKAKENWAGIQSEEILYNLSEQLNKNNSRTAYQEKDLTRKTG